MNLGNVDTHAGASNLRHLDARAKILAVVSFVVVSALLRDLRILLFAAAYILALLSISGVPARHLVGSYLLSVPFALAGAFSVYFSAGLFPALAMYLRISTCVLAVLLLSTTTPFFDLLKGLQRLRVPRLFINLLLFTYRYLFVISDELGRMSVARKARGARKGRHLLDRPGMRTISFTAGMVLVRAYGRGTRMHDALRSRGFNGKIRTLTRSRIGAAEVLFAVAVSAFAILLFFAERGLVRWL